MKKSTKRIIWTNYDLALEDWKDGILEVYPNATENEQFDIMYEWNNDYLFDERINLDIKTDGTIIAIGDIGRWNGRFTSYNIIGNNIKDCLYSNADYVTFYTQDGDLKAREIHHDGTNYITFRMIKPNLTDTQIENFLNKLYDGDYTENTIKYYTKGLGKLVNAVYGL